MTHLPVMCICSFDEAAGVVTMTKGGQVCWRILQQQCLLFLQNLQDSICATDIAVSHSRRGHAAPIHVLAANECHVKCRAPEASICKYGKRRPKLELCNNCKRQAMSLLSLMLKGIFTGSRWQQASERDLNLPAQKCHQVSKSIQTD